MTDGLRLLTKLIEEGNARALSERGIDESWFESTEIPVARFVLEFLRSHGQLPAIRTVESRCGTRLSTDAVEPVGYYLDRIEARMLQNSLRDTLNEVSRLIVDRQDPRAALELARVQVLRLSSRALARDMMDMPQALDLVLQDYEARSSQIGLSGIPTGWPTLDDQTDGIKPGDFWAIVGRIAAGKSQLLVKMASEAYLSGRRVLFVSYEMPLLHMARRLFCTAAHIPYRQVRFGQMSMFVRDRFRPELEWFRSRPGRLTLLMAGLNSMVPQVQAVIQEIRPELVLLDGGGMIKPSDRSLRARWEQVSSTAQEIRMLALVENIPIVVSYHFNREVKGNDTFGSLEHIGLSDEIGKLATLALGVFRRDAAWQRPEKKRGRIRPETERIKEPPILPGEPMVVRCMKGREGERFEFEMNFLWDGGMDFSERPPRRQPGQAPQDDIWQ